MSPESVTAAEMQYVARCQQGRALDPAFILRQSWFYPVTISILIGKLSSARGQHWLLALTMHVHAIYMWPSKGDKIALTLSTELLGPTLT